MSRRFDVTVAHDEAQEGEWIDHHGHGHHGTGTGLHNPIGVSAGATATRHEGRDRRVFHPAFCFLSVVNELPEVTGECEETILNIEY